ncbi:hypothetical protein O0L34_g13734 [Tuta absoluta]|nr:hypothetical protein O0L34_g13733 [Tuta absoluta]KAJ2951582.1 hypothetical protein O0L34_g13734 [Tuta absoluta]
MAIEYARREFPPHAARHERQLQACVCALAWCTPQAGPAPTHYQHLLDPTALGKYGHRVRSARVPPARGATRAAAAGVCVRAGVVHAASRPRAHALPASTRPYSAR